MTHYQPWISHEAYQRLCHYYFESNTIAVKVVEGFSMLTFLFDKGLLDQNGRVISY